MRDWRPCGAEEEAMPNYSYRCENCDNEAVIHRSFAVGPIIEQCPCGGTLVHDLCADIATVELDTSGCRDHNFIPEHKRVFRRGDAADAVKKEAAYAGHIKERRAALKSGNKGRIRQSMAVPADLYHGKIRETGDKQYWTDKKNVAKHNAFKVG